jgi:hypothetical protein
VSQKPPQVVRRSIDVTCSSDVHPAHLPLLSAYYFRFFSGLVETKEGDMK